VDPNENLRLAKCFLHGQFRTPRMRLHTLKQK
ncbi:uncharacterized protein METZ01_LOCUS483856, partial [marine metagenome]